MTVMQYERVCLCRGSCVYSNGKSKFCTSLKGIIVVSLEGVLKSLPSWELSEVGSLLCSVCSVEFHCVWVLVSSDRELAAHKPAFGSFMEVVLLGHCV